MAIGQVRKFSGVGTDNYNAVRAELGWDGEQGMPTELLAHAVGSAGDGFCVIEWWDWEDAWDMFFSSAARPAFGRSAAFPSPR
jgi:hypothetical protein